MKAPQFIDINFAELDAVVGRLERKELRSQDVEIIKAAAETLKVVWTKLQEKKISIQRLQRIVFGAQTEKTAEVLQNQAEAQSRTSESGAGGDPGVAATAGTPDGQDNPREGSGKPQEKPKGHGRNGASRYLGAEQVSVLHQQLTPGDPCPACAQGKLYDTKRPAVLLRLKGRSPVGAQVYELQKLRCNLCGKVFTAESPEDCGVQKWDVSAGSIIAVLKYGNGFPFHRLDNLQRNFGIPLPSSTQWDIVEAKANRIYPVYDELIRQAAQGEVLHNDDTPVKILELMNTADLSEQQDQGKQERSGMFTTGIVSLCGNHRIVLFHTGRNHAGENLQSVLQHREGNRSPPIQMCDALSRNLPKDFETILSHCLSHARRNFVDVVDLFPKECRYVFEILKEVYKHDAEAKVQKMTDEQRLEYHQSKSGPLMEELKGWLDTEIAGKNIEPNSSMGAAISYMHKHWEPLTLFLRKAGAPLDNNICERILKRAILHRKNALFFQSLHGAYIGDLYMSIIQTCALAKVNAFEYLNVLEEHSADLFKHPEGWLPWNYHKQLTTCAE